MHLNVLPDSTRRVLTRASEIAELSGCLLIGGTAMALHVAHRVSEDLDFVQFGDKLDRKLIAHVLGSIRGQDTPELVTSLVARQTFENDGMDVDDFHQDWMVDGTKVTFFCPDRRQELDVLDRAKPTSLGTVRIVDLDTIFRLKAMVVADRWTSRDAFDLVYFIERCGRTMSEVDEMIRAKLPLYPLPQRLNLLTRPFDAIDPGFQTVSDGSPRNFMELATRMQQIVDLHLDEIMRRRSEVVKNPPDHPIDEDCRPALER